MERLSIHEEMASPAGTPALYKKASPLPSKDDLKALKPPKRPGLGTLGRRSTVRANHFAVELSEALHIFHYDVSIDLAGATKLVHLSLEVNRAVLRMTVQQYGESHLGGRLLAYDGRKNVYTAGPLPLESQMFVVKLLSEKDGQEKEYNVTVRFAARLDLEVLKQLLAGKAQECPYDTIQALDVVLRTLPSLTHVSVTRSFFFKNPGDGNHTSLGDGVECWKGYYQSLRPTQMGLSLNVDQSATSFLEPKVVVEFAREYLGLRGPVGRPFSAAESAKIKNVMRNVKVDTPHRPGSFYRIRGLSSLPADQLKFDHNGRDVSVAQYFKETYSIHLEHPSLPCLVAGSDKKPSYLPMELCRIVPGQRYARKLNERQIRTMLGLTCSGPLERERSIARMVTENRYQMDPLITNFGMNVSNTPVTLQARVLAPPALKYGGRDALVSPNLGKWNMMGKQLENGARVELWAFLNLSSRVYKNVAEAFCWALVDKCQQMGMQFNPSPVIMNCNPRSGGTVDAALRNLKVQSDQNLVKMGKGDKNLQLLIIVLPDQSGYYGCIKRICETELGIVSQCCQPKNVLRNDGQYLENVSMKINVKVGGRNTVVDEYMHPVRNITDEVTIVFGADVTHPQPGEDSSPSIAAVVASMDWPGMARYRGLVSSQAHRQEIISDLYTSSADAHGNHVHGGMIRDLLRSFYSLNQHRKPTRIIFYRDGVSEGQFHDVLLYEMHAIHKACTSLDESYRPKVTFIVVQKRHHTRLFPTRDGIADRSGNVVPGTVVDTKICHPTEFDFYLCSHAGIKGTSRPTHYHVLYDANKFTADALQSFTNNLCYTFARCTRSVSVVPAAYYAHLAAFRARYYIEGDASDGGSTAAPRSVSSGGEAVVRDLPKVKDNVKEVMFFC